jgi:hypothetical protein
VAIITTLTTVAGTIIGVLTGATIGGSGRTVAEKRATEATLVIEHERTEAKEGHRLREEAKIQHRWANEA